MNIPLLLRIADRIAKHPECFNMASCDSCICGWVMRLNNHLVDGSLSWATLAFIGMQDLDLTGEQANRLFFVRDWPDQFGNAYRRTHAVAEERAAVAAARLHHFIQTEGRE